MGVPPRDAAVLFRLNLLNGKGGGANIVAEQKTAEPGDRKDENNRQLPEFGRR